MKELRDALADSLRETQPRLYGILEECVRRGESKGQIMAQINRVVRLARREPQQGELTAGCCEAAIDRLIEQRRG